MRKIREFLEDLADAGYEIFVEHHGFWEGFIFGLIVLHLLSIQ